MTGESTVYIHVRQIAYVSFWDTRQSLFQPQMHETSVFEELLVLNCIYLSIYHHVASIRWFGAVEEPIAL
jgi:hypothetical protein